MSPSLSQLTLVQNTKILQYCSAKNTVQKHYISITKNPKILCTTNCSILHQNKISKLVSFLKTNFRIRRNFRCTIVHSILHTCTQYLHNCTQYFATQKTVIQYFVDERILVTSTMKGGNVDLVDTNLMSTIQQNGFNKACCSTNQSKQQ